MKKKIIFIIVGVILLAVLGLGIFYFTKNNKTLTDGEKFAKEYETVNSNNLFVYRDIDEIISIMKAGTGVVYLGFPECPWCKAYVKYLNETAKEVGLDKIYYFNILQDRTNNTEKYQEIVKILKDELQNDEEGNPRIFVPNASFHIKGKLIGNDYETSLDTKDLDNPDLYWTDDEVKDLKDKLKIYMNDILNEINKCTECNK